MLAEVIPLAEELIVTTTPRDDHQLDLTIELGPERTEQALQRAARLVSKKAKIPGFRPGKAPFATVVRMYGKPALLGEIVDDLGQEVYTEVLDQTEIEPYGQAALEDVELDPAIKFKLIVPLRPTVDLGDYSDLRVEAPVVEVGDADVDALLEQARNARAAHEVVERPAELGDLVKVDIVGSVGENTIMDNQDWELTLRGESGWLPGFDESFVGLKAGDEKEFDITYPEDSLSKYKGQTAHFKVNVKEVRAKLTPELNDEFAQSLGEYATLAEYREKKLAEIKQQRETEAQNKLTDDAVEALIERATLAYPPGAVHDTIHDMLHDMEQRMRNIGYTLEDSLRLQGKTIEQYEQELEPAAERRVKAQLVLAELFRREGLEVTDAEVEAELDRMAAQAEKEETRKAIRDAFGTDQGRAVIRQDLRTAKTLDRLRALVTGQATSAAAPAASEATPAVSEAAPAVETPAAEPPAAEAESAE
jgi:trigger factor